LPLFWASDCLLCGALGLPGLVCRPCEHSLPRPSSVPGEVTAAYSYAFPVDGLVHRFKFGRDLAVGHWLAGRLADRLAGCEPPEVLVVPPLSRARLRERGFNPALEIARRVGRAVGSRVDVQGIERVRETASQTGLDRQARRENLRGAFRCERDYRGLNVALVDDVYTTGATAEALGALLRRQGAARVDVWVVARTPLPGGG